MKRRKVLRFKLRVGPAYGGAILSHGIDTKFVCSEWVAFILDRPRRIVKRSETYTITVTRTRRKK